jgi:hypothetical protein
MPVVVYSGCSGNTKVSLAPTSHRSVTISVGNQAFSSSGSVSACQTSAGGADKSRSNRTTGREPPVCRVARAGVVSSFMVRTSP